VSAILIVITMIVGAFAWESARLWWLQNAWRRRWRDKDEEQ
jgi:hypothetical protein